MKKLLVMLMVMLLMAGCGGTDNSSSQAAQPQQESAAQDVSDREIAESYVGKELSELKALIGEPSSSEYQDSCAEANAKDGFLYYDGFVVVTLQKDGSEIVQYIQ